jgi:hypothetical protein
MRSLMNWFTDRLQYIRFKLEQRAQTRAARKNDDNIYPLW